MGNNSRVIALFIVLIAIFGILFFVFKIGQPQAINHKAITVSLDQLSENNLQLKTVEVKSIYAESSQTNANWKKYYQVKVMDKKDRVLFATQVAKEQLVSRYTYPGYQPVAPYTEINSQIDLYLPLFNVSDKMVIEDENGNTIMSVNLRNIVSGNTSTQE